MTESTPVWRSPELVLRVVAGIALIAVALFALSLGGIVFWLLATVAALLMMAEWADLHGVAVRHKRLAIYTLFVPLVLMSPLGAGPGFLSLGLLAGAAFFIVIITNRRELALVAAACAEHDLICISDEVYEHLVYDGEHVPPATLPGMAGRTLTISSVGKSFSFTGWKIGWCSGPAELVTATRTAKQFLTFAGGTPLQHAAAAALGLPRAALDTLRDDLAQRRDQLCEGLTAAGLHPLIPAATYFVNADVGSDAAEFCRSLPQRAGVVAIPTSVFYDDKLAAPTLVRFAFCKRPEVIAEAAARLAAM